MHAITRMSTLALILVVPMGLAGCRHLEREMEIHFGWLHQASAPVAQERPVYRKVRKNRSITKPPRVAAGAKLREYCGRRHIQFQKGTLRETDAEKIRNNNLCYQIYKS